MERKISEELKKHIEECVFPQYGSNEQGHGIEHILNVIDREFELIEENPLDLNNNMVYAIGAYHDIGHHIDAKNHEIVSAELFMQDEKIKMFFHEEERKIIKEAIEDHRASNSNEARSIYGKLVSSADRNTEYISIFIRTYSYNIKLFQTSTNQQLIEEAYEHLKNKYGERGYAKMYFKDRKYENFLKQVRDVLKDKTRFEIEYREINNMN